MQERQNGSKIPSGYERYLNALQAVIKNKIPQATKDGNLSELRNGLESIRQLLSYSPSPSPKPQVRREYSTSEGDVFTQEEPRSDHLEFTPRGKKRIINESKRQVHRMLPQGIKMIIQKLDDPESMHSLEAVMTSRHTLQSLLSFAESSGKQPTFTQKHNIRRKRTVKKQIYKGEKEIISYVDEIIVKNIPRYIEENIQTLSRLVTNGSITKADVVMQDIYQWLNAAKSSGYSFNKGQQNDNIDTHG